MGRKVAFIYVEAVTKRYSVKKMFLEIWQNSQENTYDRVSFLIKLQACNCIEKETLAQVFSCEFYKIFKNIFFLQNNSSGCFRTWTERRNSNTNTAQS